MHSRSDAEQERKMEDKSIKTSRRLSVSKKGGYSKSVKAQWKKQKESQTFSSDELDDFQQIFEFFDIENTKTMDLQLRKISISIPINWSHNKLIFVDLLQKHII